MPTTFDFAAFTAVVASDEDIFIYFSRIAIHTEQLLSFLLPTIAQIHLWARHKLYPYFS